MLTQTALHRVLVLWREQCGISKYGRMWVPIDGRRDAYKSLIKTLIEKYNYTLDDLDGSTYRAVMEISIPEGSEKKERWRHIATEDWYIAVSVFFPEESQIVIHDPSNDPVPGASYRKNSEPVIEYEEGPAVLKNPAGDQFKSAVEGANIDVLDEDAFLKELHGAGDE